MGGGGHGIEMLGHEARSFVTCPTRGADVRGSAGAGKKEGKKDGEAARGGKEDDGRVGRRSGGGCGSGGEGYRRW